MNKYKLNVTYRRYLGPALYDLIRTEQSRPMLPITADQVAKLAKEKIA